ncbi:MAG: hypothetical protein DI586_00150 [Micavibrio aeruginosavorus]|uniref:Pili assembly chaperone N-terminal domain-containing protein n=1 Tax=Micavibrio aeruginosavorus TaxID=349221 RepID=A0A2W5FNE3_9BACT|nr:MAG: hypothetical protein DI586_00150 [Micavibrio aeruginosavorus]
MKKNRNFLTLLAVQIILTALYAIPAFASEILFVSPTRVNLSEKSKVAVMNVTNMSNLDRTYTVGVKDIIMLEKGVTQTVDNFDYSAKKMLRFFPRQFTIPAGQKQSVRIMAKMPADTPDGQYHSHVYFLEDSTKQSKPEVEGLAVASGQAVTSVPLAYSVMMPVTLSKGKVETSVNWIDPKISKSVKPGAQPGTYTVSMQLTRSGNGQGVAFFDVLYDSKQIGKRRTAYIYREIDKRDYKFDFKLPEGIQGGKIQLRLLTGEKSKPDLVQETSLSIP